MNTTFSFINEKGMCFHPKSLFCLLKVRSEAPLVVELQHLAAANEDGREILNDVGIGISCVYSIDSQYLVNQCGKSG